MWDDVTQETSVGWLTAVSLIQIGRQPDKEALATKTFLTQTPAASRGHSWHGRGGAHCFCHLPAIFCHGVLVSGRLWLGFVCRRTSITASITCISVLKASSG